MRGSVAGNSSLYPCKTLSIPRGSIQRITDAHAQPRRKDQKNLFQALAPSCFPKSIPTSQLAIPPLIAKKIMTRRAANMAIMPIQDPSIQPNQILAQSAIKNIHPRSIGRILLMRSGIKLHSDFIGSKAKFLIVSDKFFLTCKSYLVTSFFTEKFYHSLHQKLSNSLTAHFIANNDFFYSSSDTSSSDVLVVKKCTNAPNNCVYLSIEGNKNSFVLFIVFKNCKKCLSAHCLVSMNWYQCMEKIFPMFMKKFGSEFFYDKSHI